uniref:DUF7344 domain-containing protein n=1 Tax=Natronorubrum sp. DTA7 TaxID=3447016 RepID=UPI003F879AE2
ISNERYHLDIATSTHDDVQLISVDSEPFSTEAQTLAKLVLNTRSWHVIQILQLAEKPLGVESIAGRIASIENTDRQDVYIDLVHMHLPKLADEGLLYYDSDVEIVELSDRIDAVANATDEISEASRQLEEIEQ